MSSFLKSKHPSIYTNTLTPFLLSVQVFDLERSLKWLYFCVAFFYSEVQPRRGSGVINLFCLIISCNQVNVWGYLKSTSFWERLKCLKHKCLGKIEPYIFMVRTKFNLIVDWLEVRKPENYCIKRNSQPFRNFSVFPKYASFILNK